MHYVYTNNLKLFFELKINLPIKLITNFEKFKNIASTDKIIVYFPLNNCAENFNFYKNLSDAATFVFVIDQELWAKHVTLMQECAILKNLFWYRPGFLNINDILNMKFYGGWFYRGLELYKDIPHKLQEINSYNSKDCHFEALLGLKRIHRDFIFEQFKEYNFKNKITLKYCNPDSNDWFIEPDSNYIQSVEEKNNSSTIFRCRYGGGCRRRYRYGFG